MPHLIDASTWGSRGIDIAFKDPFSAVTTSIRKKLIFFSSLAILNHYFQIDLSGSHILGIHFIGDNTPSLSGLIGLVVAYFTISLSIYTYQEIKAWISQAKLLEFKAHKDALSKMTEINASSHATIKSAVEQLSMNNNYEGVSDEHDRLNVHQESFINSVANLEGADVTFEQELNKLKDKYEQSHTSFKAAMTTQFIKVGILEIALPFAIALLSIYFSFNGMAGILNVVF